MNPNKVCKVGARKALTAYFTDARAIDADGMIMDRDTLLTAHNKLRGMLKESYGVDREIINTSSTAPMIQFNEGVLKEINQISGSYFREDIKYGRDMSDDNTLTPIDLVHKYIATDDSVIGLKVVNATDFTADQLGKLKVGMRQLYPEVSIVASQTRSVNGSPRFTILLKETIEPTGSPIVVDANGPMAEVYQTREMEVVTATLEPLLKVFKSATINWVTPQEMNKMLAGKKPKVVAAKGNNITGVAVGKDIYLVKGMVTPATGIEELMHLFVDSLYNQRKALYTGLLREATDSFPMLAAQIELDYSDENGFSQDDRNRELVTKALRDAYIKERTARPKGVTPKSFLERITDEFIRLSKEFFKWLAQKVGSATDLPLDTLPVEATLSDIAFLLNIDGFEIPVSETSDVRFSIEEGDLTRGEFDDEDIIEELAQSTKQSKKDLKINRANDQYARLYKLWENLKAENNPAKAGALKTLYNLLMLTERLKNDVYQKDVKTVSVTKFAGTPVFDERFKATAQASIDYGIFQHLFLEELMVAASEKDMTIGKFLRENPSFFDGFYDQWAKEYLKYDGITKDQIKDDIMQVVDIVAADSLRGIIIPEITIYANDSNNQVVEGRLDYIIITNDGRIEPGDFKTHKSPVFLKSYSSSPLTRKHQSKKLEEGVHSNFTLIPNRSKYTDYLTQVGIYSRMLKQQGFDSLPGFIISTIYYPKQGLEEWVYKGAHVVKIPIVGEEGLMMGRDSNGNPTADVDPRFQRIMNLIQDAIPVEGETTDTNDAQELVDKFQGMQDIPVETVKQLNDTILAKIEEQLENIRKQMSEAQRLRADETKIKAMRDRKALLNEAKINFMKPSTGEVRPEVLLKTALEQVFQLINSLSTEAQNIKDGSENLRTKISDLGSRAKQLADLISFLDLVKNALIQSNFPADNFILIEVAKATNVALKGQQYYIDIAKDQMLKLLETVNPKLAERMMESMRMYLGFRKNRLNRIIAGDNSIFSDTTFWLGGKINEVFNKVVNKVVPRTINQDMKEAAQQELKTIEFWEKNQKYDSNFVRLYVDNTWNNPESGFYIGSTITPREASWSGDDFVASFSNSELAIAAMAGYGIRMTEGARMEFLDRMEKLSIDQLYENMTRKYGSYEAAVAAISQEIEMTDFRAGEKKRYRLFLTPELMAYYEIYNRLDYAVLSLKEQRNKIKQDPTIAQAEKEAKLADLNIKLNAAEKERIDWRLENSETKLKKEVYELEVQLPIEIQEKIDEIRNKIQQLLSPTGDDDLGLKDSIIEEVQKLEYEISKLKKQAMQEDASLAEIFEKYEKYYIWEPNFKRWEYQRDWHKRKWGEDSPQFKAWMKLNSDYVPLPSWQKRVNELRKEKSEIYAGTDPVMDELWERRGKLIEKYKFKSNYSINRVFNPLFMSEEDYEELVEIDDEIEARQYSESRPRPILSKEESKRLREIDDELTRISGKENKPSYVFQFSDMRDELVHMRDQINKLKTDPTKAEELARMEAQYVTKEIAFQTWYNRNNKSEYQLGTIERLGTVSMDPRSFNVVTVPMDESMMVVMPNSKYRMRSYTEAAYNPNYSPTLMKRKYGAGSYEMPIGISYNKETGRYDVDPNSKWANPDYLRLMKDPKGMDFYNQIVMDLYINMQANMSAQKLGHFYPSVAQPGFESVAQDGFAGLMREGRELVENIKLYDSAMEQDDNEFGMLGTNRIRFPHNSLWTADLTTKDGLNAILKWNLSYTINQAMEEADLMMSPAIDYLKAMRDQIPEKDEAKHLIRKQIDKVIDIWEFERNKFIYGQTMNVDPGSMRSNLINRKMFRGIMSLASFGRLGFDPVAQTGNLVSGNVQAYMAGEVGRQGIGGTRDLLWAKGQMYGPGGFFYKVVQNWGELSGLTLETKILRYFNPAMKDFDRLLDSTGRGQTRRLLMRGFNVKDIAFIVQDKGEMEIAMTTMLKNLKANRFNVYAMDAQNNFILDDNGNKTFKKDASGNIVTVSAYEALIDAPGSTPGIRKDVAMDMTDMDAIKMRTYYEYLQYQGNYSNYMKPRAESSIIGILITFFRKYLIPSIELRFAGLRGMGDPKNWTAGDIQVGWWTAMREILRYGERGSFIEALLPTFISKPLGMNKLNLLYRSKAMQARREIVVATAFTIAAVMLRSLLYNDDDDEQDLNWATLQAMRIMAKVANESRSLVWMPVIGKADDYVTNFSTFTTAFNEGKMYANLVENTIWYVNAQVFDSEHAREMALYQKKSGRNEKGDPKFYANLLKISGVENMLDFFEPIFAAKEVYKRKG